jgi:hypothetical protein
LKGEPITIDDDDVFAIDKTKLHYNKRKAHPTVDPNIPNSTVSRTRFRKHGSQFLAPIRDAIPLKSESRAKRQHLSSEDNDIIDLTPKRPANLEDSNTELDDALLPTTETPRERRDEEDGDDETNLLHLQAVGENISRDFDTMVRASLWRFTPFLCTD